jgi:hypothetical protein
MKLTLGISSRLKLFDNSPCFSSALNTKILSRQIHELIWRLLYVESMERRGRILNRSPSCFSFRWHP